MSSVAATAFVRSSLVRQVREAAREKRRAARPASGDMQLFASTFAAGFLFVSLFIA